VECVQIGVVLPIIHWSPLAPIVYRQWLGDAKAVGPRLIGIVSRAKDIMAIGNGSNQSSPFRRDDSGTGKYSSRCRSKGFRNAGDLRNSAPIARVEIYVRWRIVKLALHDFDRCQSRCGAGGLCQQSGAGHDDGQSGESCESFHCHPRCQRLASRGSHAGHGRCMKPFTYGAPVSRVLSAPAFRLAQTIDLGNQSAVGRLR
jgi:hypothetical protein